MTVHLVIPDSHAQPDYKNDRADWLGKFMLDLKPDVVVNIGDMFDMPSMCSYDKGKKSFQGRTYKKDLDAGLEFDDRLWHSYRKAKRRLPYRVFCEGNHENRLKKALELSPELEGSVSFNDFGLDRNYDSVVEYNGSTPGNIQVDGIFYAHFFISGIMGRAIQSEHHAYNLIQKQSASCTAGHSHTTDYCVRRNINGDWRMGLVAGCYFEHDPSYAGAASDLWWRGVIVKRKVENGYYEPQWVSINSLKEKYG